MKTVLLAIALTAALPAHAQPRRIAVLVGANRGSPGRTELRYSYSDAEQMASVLTQLGEFSPDDVRVLRDPAPQEILDELDKDLALLGAAGGESILLLSYSGHADGAALYPGGQPLPFTRLRERLESRAATVRVGIIDTCDGGGWTGTKGFRVSAPFVDDAPMQLTSEGSVLIASSSGAEIAHESEQVYGSFFTHHFVAALRGAAQKNGVVNLTDAFAYAKERTVRDSAAVAEPQHPSFSMNLRGRSDLPLTRVSQSKTLVRLSETEGPLQVIHLGSGLVVMEVPAGKRVLELSVPSGRYLLRKQRETGNYSREIVVSPGEPVVVDEADLQLSPFPREGGKLFQSGVDGWPLAVNDRPLTLRGGMAEIQLGLLYEDNWRGRYFLYPDHKLQNQFLDVTGGNPLALAPSIRFGVTDRLTLSAGTPGGLCISSDNCAWINPGANVAGLYLLTSGFIETAALASVAIDRLDRFPVGAGLTARVGGGRMISLQLTAQLGDTPFEGRSAGYSLGAKLVFQPGPEIAIDASIVVGHRFNAAEADFTPAVFGATLPLGHHFDVRGQILYGNMFGIDASSPTDLKQYGALLVYRP
jgi:hypothetical protein